MFVFFLGILLMVSVLVFFLVSNQDSSQGSNGRKKIIITGLSNSFKTKLFYKLLKDKLINTITSFSINRGITVWGEKKVEIIDISGNASFDRELFSSFNKNSILIFTVNQKNKFFKKKLSHAICSEVVQNSKTNKILVSLCPCFYL